jgi:hypothetical protein
MASDQLLAGVPATGWIREHYVVYRALLSVRLHEVKQKFVF